MAAQSIPPTRKDDRGYQWIDFTDFTPGIYQYEPNTLSPINPNKPAPFGACTAETFGCLPILSGGLSAGPGYVGSHNADLSDFSDTGVQHISQLYCNTSLEASDPEFIFTLEGVDSSGDNWLQKSYSWFQRTQNAITNAEQTYSGVTDAQPYGCLSFSTRISIFGFETTAGLPVIVFALPAGNGLTPVSMQPILVYPDPTTEGDVFQAYNINNDYGNPPSGVCNPSGLILGHQGRVVVFGQELDNWPVSNFISNEQCFFTDPANSIVFGQPESDGTGEIFAPEIPFGYSCGGTQSAGELFLVKPSGMGLVVTGDLNNPNVTILPGVQPGGQLPSYSPLNGVENSSVNIGQCASGSQGIYYCSSNAGAWIWNGGSISQKISSQMDDNFFYNPDTPPPYSGLTFYICRWGPFIMFSNNWIYNELTSSWWRLSTLSDDSPFPYFWYGIDRNSSLLYAAPTTIGRGSSSPEYASIADTFSLNQPASGYLWVSQPVRLSEDQFVDIREVSVRATCAQSTGSVFITLIDENNNVSQISPISNFPGNIYGPYTFRVPGGFKCQTLKLSIAAQNESPYPAPTVFSVSIGFRIREKLGVPPVSQ